MKNFSKKLDEAYNNNLSGEYWIIDGVSMYADGDIGQYNHEGYVIDYILSNYGIDYDEYDRMSLDELLELGMTPEEIEVVDYNNNKDPREYAIRKFGWIRIINNEVECYVVNKSTLNEIADGLYDAYSEAVENSYFNISESKNNKYYKQVPWAVIEGGDLMSLRNYIEH